MKSKYNTIPISDLYTAAFLISMGCDYREFTRSGKKVTFHFPPSANRLIQDYFHGAKCSCLAFRNAIENLKTVIFSFDSGRKEI